MGCFSSKKKENAQLVYPENPLPQIQEIQLIAPLSRLQKTATQDRNQLYVVEIQNEKNKCLIQQNHSQNDYQKNALKKIEDPPHHDADYLEYINIPQEKKETRFKKNADIQRKKEMEEREAQLTEIQNLKDQLKNQQNEAKYQIQELQHNLEAQTKKINEMEMKYQQQETKIELQKSQIDNYEQEKNKQLVELEEQKKKLKQKEEVISQLQDDVFDLNFDKVQKQSELQDYESKKQKYHEELEKLRDFKSKLYFGFRDLQDNQESIREKQKIDEILDQFELKISDIVAIQPLPLQNKEKIRILFNCFQECQNKIFFKHNCQSIGYAQFGSDCFIYCTDNTHKVQIESADFFYNDKLVAQRSNKREKGLSIDNFLQFEKFLFQCLEGKQLQHQKFITKVKMNYLMRNQGII